MTVSELMTILNTYPEDNEIVVLSFASGGCVPIVRIVNEQDMEQFELPTKKGVVCIVVED